MPRKSKDKEIIIEETKKIPKKVAKTSSDTSKKASTPKKTSTAKSTTVKKTATSKVNSVKKTSTARKAATTKKVSAKKPSVAKKSTADKKTATKTVTTKKTTVKKTATAKKVSTDKKVATAKKTSTTRKVSTDKKATTKKTTTKKVASTKSKKDTKSKISAFSPLSVLEYYDLPYRYNETVVKVLAQNPNTLFVYWDINDNDRKHFEDTYGKDFFTKTKPVLVVHNTTDNYTYEIDINDFANNWYINVDDTKCKYSVELGRRPIYSEQEQKLDYLNIAYSNTIEIPNDHILFFKENDKIYFKNIKTNKITEKTFKSKLYGNGVSEIYKNYNINDSQDKYDLNNPSSDFLSSNVL